MTKCPDRFNQGQFIGKRRRRANKYVQRHNNTLHMLTLPHLIEYMHSQNRLIDLDTIKSPFKDTPNTK
jgi:hypothetical protein